MKGTNLRNFDPKSREGDMVRVFDVEDCESCGELMMACNSMVIGATDGQLRFIGLRERDAPEEGGYSEVHGGSVCSKCQGGGEGNE